MQDNDNYDSSVKIMEEYIRGRGHASRRWIRIVTIISLILLIILFKITVIDQKMEESELKAAIEIFSVDSQWMIKERINKPDFKGIVIVPEISFRLRNRGARDLKYVYFLGIFRFIDSGRIIGEGATMAVKKALSPGEESERILVRSVLGYQGTSKNAFEKHRKEWRNAMVEIYAKSHHSDYVFLKTVYIRQKIEGTDIDIKLI